MNNRIKMLLISLLCLFLGTAIYIFSRPNVYISRFVLRFLNIGGNYIFFPTEISFYLPDLLWSAALRKGPKKRFRERSSQTESSIKCEYPPCFARRVLFCRQIVKNVTHNFGRIWGRVSKCVDFYKFWGICPLLW